MAFDNSDSGQGDQHGQGGGDSPFLTNRDQGAAAWLNTDKNGNAYISIKLPLGLGTLNLFGNTEEDSDALNQLYQHLNGGDG